MSSGVWSFGGRTKIGRMNLFPVKREYQYFLQGYKIINSLSREKITYLYLQPRTKLRSMRRRATPAVQPIPM